MNPKAPAISTDQAFELVERSADLIHVAEEKTWPLWLAIIAMSIDGALNSIGAFVIAVLLCCLLYRRSRVVYVFLAIAVGVSLPLAAYALVVINPEPSFIHGIRLILMVGSGVGLITARPLFFKKK